jgi:hypothetical protein
MISTVHQLTASLLVAGLSRWLRTDLILSATLLFLVFASWAMLTAAQSSTGPRHFGAPPNRGSQLTDRSDPSAKTVADRGLETMSIVLGLLGSFALLAICAW